MSEIKYTNDGRKVAVIGQLNAQETIVQEIFISEGQEVPSGENFVVKSLHDKPAKSWYSTEKERIESNYKKTRDQYECEIKRLRQSHKKIVGELKNKTSYLREFINEATVESFDRISQFLSGEIKYLVRESYSPDIIKYEDFNCDYEEKLKLITLFGRDDGTLSFGINRYSDGSGHNDHYYPYTNLEDAVAKLQEVFNSKQWIHNTDIKTAKKYNIKLNQKLVDEYKSKRIKEIEKNIETHVKNLDTQKETLKDLNNL